MKNKDRPESYHKKKIKDWMKRNGWDCWFVSPRWIHGFPDILAIDPNGVVVFVEVKRWGKEPTENQYNFINRIKGKSDNICWCQSLEEFLYELSEMEIGYRYTSFPRTTFSTVRRNV